MHSIVMKLAQISALVGVLSALGCGAKTSLQEPTDLADVSEETQDPDGGQLASSSRTFVEQCYKPAPGEHCLSTKDPTLPARFPECRSPAEIAGDPITDINLTTGLVRCCYEVSDESCEF